MKIIEALSQTNWDNEDEYRDELLNLNIRGRSFKKSELSHYIFPEGWCCDNEDKHFNFDDWHKLTQLIQSQGEGMFAAGGYMLVNFYEENDYILVFTNLGIDLIYGTKESFEYFCKKLNI